jgi:hypothetical protein
VSIQSDLAGIAASPDFYRDAYALTQAWEADGLGAEAIDSILSFMEKHPDLDYGAPGPLTHFVESVRGPDYGARLVQSVNRIPTMSTLLMLNRLINGTDEASERRPLLVCLRQSRARIQGDPEAADMVQGFLDRSAEIHPGE